MTLATQYTMVAPVSWASSVTTGGGYYIQLFDPNTGLSYTSINLVVPGGPATFVNIPNGRYQAYVSAQRTGPFTAIPGSDGWYVLAADATGATDLVAHSLMVLASGPYTPSPNAGTIGNEWWVAPPTGVAATDTTAINAAITSCNAAGGGIVHLQLGTYLTTGVTHKSNVVLRGAGWGTILKLAAATNVDLISGASLSLAGVEDLMIDGNRANQTSADGGISFTTAATRCWVRHVYLLNSGPVNINNGTECKILDCTGNACSGLSFQNGGTDGLIQGNVLLNVQAFGGGGCVAINTSGGNGTQTRHSVVGNVIDGVTNGLGISFDGDSQNCIASGNSVYNSSGDGINCEANTGNNTVPRNCAIVGNVVRKCRIAATGLAAFKNKGATIVGNAIDLEGTALAGINVTQCASGTVGHNTVRNCGLGGIQIDNSNNITVVGNDISNNGQTSAWGGVNLTTTTSDIVIESNRCFDDQGVKTQNYGLYIQGTPTNIRAMLNDFEGNLTGRVGGWNLVGGTSFRFDYDGTGLSLYPVGFGILQILDQGGSASAFAINRLSGVNNDVIISNAGTGKIRLQPNNNAAVEAGIVNATSGDFAVAGRLYPGVEATGAQQFVGGILHSTGIPSNTNGNNNDWAISDNGHFYFKTAGAWVQKV